MTKEQLREYESIRRELQVLEGISRKLETCGDEKLKVMYRIACKKLRDKLAAVESALETLTPTERNIMRLRYIYGKPWETIARQVAYSKQQTMRIHARALVKLSNI